MVAKGGHTVPGGLVTINPLVIPKPTEMWLVVVKSRNKEI